MHTVKTFGLLQPYFGHMHLSCMPVVCVTHALQQTSREATNLILNQNVAENFPLCEISIFFQKAYSFSDEVGVFFYPTHLSLEECLACMVVVEMPGV